jgi:hypothetical protein
MPNNEKATLIGVVIGMDGILVLEGASIAAAGFYAARLCAADAAPYSASEGSVVALCVTRKK